jgi:hypothetical protein
VQLQLHRIIITTTRRVQQLQLLRISNDRQKYEQGRPAREAAGPFH